MKYVKKTLSGFITHVETTRVLQYAIIVGLLGLVLLGQIVRPIVTQYHEIADTVLSFTQYTILFVTLLVSFIDHPNWSKWAVRLLTICITFLVIMIMVRCS